MFFSIFFKTCDHFQYFIVVQLSNVGTAATPVGASRRLSSAFPNVATSLASHDSCIFIRGTHGICSGNNLFIYPSRLMYTTYSIDGIGYGTDDWL